MADPMPGRGGEGAPSGSESDPQLTPSRRAGAASPPVPVPALSSSPRFQASEGAAAASTWSPGMPPPTWQHSQEVVPGGTLATVSRVNTALRSLAGRHRTPGDEEAGGGGGGLGTPLLAGYDPPTLPIIPPPAPSPPSPGAVAGAATARLASRASLAANILLLAAKVAAFVVSRSRAVQASAVDSLVDLASQAVLAWAAAAAAPGRDERYPVGKARASTLGVAAAAAIMIGATVLVCVAAVEDLYAGLVAHAPPALEVGPALFSVLLGGTALKMGLFLLCERAARSAPAGAGDTLTALAEDHRTDALTNVVAAAAAEVVAVGGPPAWPADPVAALALAAYILAVWSRIFSRTVGKIIGRAAPAEVMAALEAVVAAEAAASGEGAPPPSALPAAPSAPSTAASFTVDVLKAWYSGDALLCECEIVMHPATPLRLSHDVALRLQHALEAVRVGDVAVERAYVHVDWARRAEPEHAPDRVAEAAAAVGRV